MAGLLYVPSTLRVSSCASRKENSSQKRTSLYTPYPAGHKELMKTWLFLRIALVQDQE
jgi:hypothetical protein